MPAQAGDFTYFLRRAPEKRSLLWLAGLIVAVVVLNALAQLWLNHWQGSFYDAVAQRDLRLFFWNLGLFAVIAGVLLVLGVAQTWFHENLKVKLRQAVTFDLIDEWLRPMRAYRLPLLGQHRSRGTPPAIGWRISGQRGRSVTPVDAHARSGAQCQSRGTGDRARALEACRCGVPCRRRAA
jgi:hypothetical protein